MSHLESALIFLAADLGEFQVTELIYLLLSYLPRASQIYSCFLATPRGMQGSNFSNQQSNTHCPPAAEVWSFNDWTTREVPGSQIV